LSKGEKEIIMEAKFVIQDEHTKTFKNAIEKVFKRTYNDICTGVINTSEITKCDRKIYYRITTTEDSKDLKLDKHRKVMIDKWHEILKNSGYDPIESYYHASDHNYNIFAKIDFICRISELPVVLMVEEVDNLTFKNAIAKRPHVVQLMTQMWLSEVNDGFLIYEDALTKEINVFHILPDVSVLNAVKGKLRTLRSNKMMGILPERKYETSNSKECRECCFIDRCWR